MLFIVIAIFAFSVFNIYSIYDNTLVLERFRNSISLLDINISVKINNDNNLEINIPKNMWRKLVYSNIYISSYTINNNRIIILAKPESRKFYLLKIDEENHLVQYNNCSYITFRK